MKTTLRMFVTFLGTTVVLAFLFKLVAALLFNHVNSDVPIRTCAYAAIVLVLIAEFVLRTIRHRDNRRHNGES